MDSYPHEKFQEAYRRIKEKKPDIIKDRQVDMKTREKLHNELIREIDFESISKIKVTDDEIFSQLKKSDFLISDFGSFCDIDEKYDEDFGTRYYRAPENILVSEDLNYGADIWSLGCTIYELLRNRYIFNPSTTSKYSADHHHLSSIFQLGRFSNKEIKSFGRRKEFFTKSKELVKLPKTDSVIDRINKLENNFWKGLVLSMLTVSYKQRPSARRLLDSLV
jgi:serine/threonine protein kinase